MKNILFLFIGIIAFSQNVLMDNTFGNFGAITTNITPPYSADLRDCFVTSQQKIITVGAIDLVDNYKYRIRLAGYLNNGTLDQNFGVNGIVDNYITESERPHCSILQLNDKLIVGGLYSNATESGSLLLRYNSNGTYDSSFGVNGIVKIPFLNNYLEDVFDFDAISLFSNNKFIVAGSSRQYVDEFVVEYAKLMKFNSDGTVDTSFGTNGKLTLVYPNNINFNHIADVQVLPDDTFICAGYMLDYGREQTLVVAKFNADGTLFTSFGINGIKLIDTSSTNIEVCSKMVVKNDGTIFLAGYSNVNFMIKLLPDSNFDVSFGVNGILYPPFSTRVFALQNDKIIFCSNLSIPNTTNTAYRFRRIDGNGLIDATFNPPLDWFDYDLNEFRQYLWDIKVINNKLISYGGARVGSNTSAGQFFLTRTLLDQNLSTTQNDKELTVAFLFPNPNKGSFTINSFNSVSVSIFDILGKAVFNQQNVSNLTPIQTQLSKGVYLVKVQEESGKTTTQKMIID